jgi:tRNA-specific 2-thiouridylase
MMTTSGEQVGEHRGIARYTVGQRKGLGISLGMPMFVSSIDADTNTIVVGERDELGCGGFSAAETSWVNEPMGARREVLVQYRSHGDVYAARIESSTPGRVEVTFDHPVEAVARGQSAAFYDAANPEELLGGGVISSTLAAAHV